MSARPLALVTGGCRRLGAHIAARLARAGYELALHAGHDVTLEPWLEPELAGNAYATFRADLDDPGAGERLLADVAARFGRPVDLLVNSASRFAALAEGTTTHDDMMAHLGVNLAAPVALAVAVAAAAGPRGASVVNVLDQRIANPPRDQLAYTLSKQALAEATRTLARTLAPRVRVNGVAPGLVIPTDEYAAGQFERVGERMPLGRNADPAEVADAVAWLAGAHSVTGQILFVDGGAHLESFARDFVHIAR